MVRLRFSALWFFPNFVEMCQCFGGNRFLLVQGKVLRCREWRAKMEAVIAHGSRCDQSVCGVVSSLHYDLACRAVNNNTAVWNLCSVCRNPFYRLISSTHERVGSNSETERRVTILLLKGDVKWGWRTFRYRAGLCWNVWRKPQRQI
jgi:hypothetical protein